MLVAAVFLALAPLPVRAELVEAPFFSSEGKNSPSTSSGRTEGGKAQTPIDAERAFTADAKTLGQWTAFAKWSADDAVMFVPQPVNAHVWLKDRKDSAKAVDWWPTASYVSCDGNLAVNTGGWKRPDGSVGYFTTVWLKQPDGGWKWVLDSGDALEKPRQRPAYPKLRVASCTGAAGYEGLYIGNMGGGASRDHTLNWSWTASDDGSRTLRIGLWNGRTFDAVIDDEIAGSPPGK